MSAAVSPIEQMVVVLARDLADGELGAAGAAALVPMAAIALARELHAPNLTVGGEMFFNPEPGRLWVGLRSAQAMVKRAELVVAEARRNLERDEVLNKRGALAKEQVAATRARLELSEADIETAQASVDRTRLDLVRAQEVVSSAIDRVSTLRGRLGAFNRYTVGSTIRSLGVALENTSAAESAIRDTDFAKETAEMTRSQILVQAATNALGIANSQPQNALSLLR